MCTMLLQASVLSTIPWVLPAWGRGNQHHQFQQSYRNRLENQPAKLSLNFRGHWWPIQRKFDFLLIRSAFYKPSIGQSRFRWKKNWKGSCRSGLPERPTCPNWIACLLGRAQAGTHLRQEWMNHHLFVDFFLCPFSFIEVELTSKIVRYFRSAL